MSTNDSYIFLDYASTTPLEPSVREIMLPYFVENFYNPNALYSKSLEVRKVIENCREKIAVQLFARPSEIYFIDGGTEANNLAIIGTLKKWQADFPQKKANIITTPIEHASVLEACENSGAEVRYLEVNEQGIIDTKKIRELLDENTCMVSIGMGNNEIGVLQDITAIAKEIRHFRKHSGAKIYPLFHTDAVQTVHYITLDTRSLGVDMMTIAASKFYGPKKIACLYIKSGIQILPILKGGDQERGLRAGTENVPAIIGMAHALEIACSLRMQEFERLHLLKESLLQSLTTIPSTTINGATQREQSLPHIVNVSFDNVSGEELVIRLDARGFAVATRSACSTNSDEESHVLRSIHPNAKVLDNNIRISFGRGTTREQLNIFFINLKEIVEKIRETKEKFT